MGAVFVSEQIQAGVHARPPKGLIEFFHGIPFRPPGCRRRKRLCNVDIYARDGLLHRAPGAGESTGRKGCTVSRAFAPRIDDPQYRTGRCACSLPAARAARGALVRGASIAVTGTV